MSLSTLARHLVSPLAALVLGTSLMASEPIPGIAPIRELLEQHVAARDQVGVAMAMVDEKGLLWSGSFGMADKDKKTPVTAATAFELGSISKVFTCLAIMQLRDQKKVDLDKPYLAYVPEFAVKSRFPGGAGAITVRMLMTHQSGLVTDDDAWETTQPARDFHRAVLTHVKDTELCFAPGQGWNYSSFGTSLLGVLVERLSGMDFADYMKKQVLQPMGMAKASFDHRDMDPTRLSAGYHYHPAYNLIPKDEIRPGGSLRATVEEASHLLSLVLQGGTVQGQRIVSTEALNEMIRLQNGPKDENPMGLGFRIRTHEVEGAGRVTTLYHDGVARNRALFVLVPAWKTGFVLALNDHQKSEMFLWELRETFLKAFAPIKKK